MPFSKQEVDTVLVRFGGEIGIKAAWTRKLYERRLIANIKAALKHYSIQHSGFVRSFGRLYIKTEQAKETAEKLGKVFGISSLSPVVRTTSKLDDVLNVSIGLASSRFKKGKHFAVRCHRIGKHSFTSQDVCRRVGRNLITQLPKLKLQVDLTHPEQTLHIEVREDKAYVFTDIFKGAGGLPLGTQPKIVSLLKGDTSSALACWMAMKRGCPAIPIYLEDGAADKKPCIEKVINVAQKLLDWSIGFPRRLQVIEYGQNLQRFIEKHPLELSNLLCKRLMLRIAQCIAIRENAEGIVTGDLFRKKASQTLHTFRIQDEAIQGYPVYRPLLGLDAYDTGELAQRLNLEEIHPDKAKSRTETYEIQTAAVRIDDVKKIEKELKIEKIMEDALKSLKVLSV